MTLDSLYDFVFYKGITRPANVNLEEIPNLIHGELIKHLRKVMGFTPMEICNKLNITKHQLKQAEKMITSRDFTFKDDKNPTNDEKTHVKIHNIQLRICKEFFNMADNDEVIYTLNKVWTCSILNLVHDSPYFIATSVFSICGEMDKLQSIQDLNHRHKNFKDKMERTKFTMWKYEYALNIAKCVRLVLDI